MVIEPEDCRIQHHREVHFRESLPVSQIQGERHKSSEEFHHIDGDRSPIPTRPRPSAWEPWPRKRSTSAGAPTRRWLPAERRFPGRRAEGGTDGPFDGYLGLTLRNPLVASASPLSIPSTASGAGRRRCRRGGALLPVRGATAPGGRVRTHGRPRLGTEGFRRVPVLLPGRGRDPRRLRMAARMNLARATT